MYRVYAIERSPGKERRAQRNDEQGAAAELCEAVHSPSRFRLWKQSGWFNEDARRERRTLPGLAASRQNHVPPGGEDGRGPQPRRSTGFPVIDARPFRAWGWSREARVLFCDGRPAPASVRERLYLAARAAGSED